MIRKTATQILDEYEASLPDLDEQPHFDPYEAVGEAIERYPIRGTSVVSKPAITDIPDDGN